MLRMKMDVSIKYHKIDLFMDMFQDNLAEHLEKFRESLSPKFNRDMVFMAGEGAGRSGSFFFFSHDKEFIIKTMYENELKVFIKALPKYFEYL